MAQDTKPAVRAHRVDLAITVDLKLPTRDAFVERFAPNLSRTGVFIRAKQPAPVGSRVRFEYRLADGSRVLRGIGLVRTSRAPADAREPDAPPGMGIEFVDLDADSEQLVARVVARFGDGARAPRRSTGGKTGGPAAASPGARAAAPKLSRDEESQLDSLLDGLGSERPPAAGGGERAPAAAHRPAPASRALADGLTPAWIEATAAGIAAEAAAPEGHGEAGRDDLEGERPAPTAAAGAPHERPELDGLELDRAPAPPAVEALEITAPATSPAAAQPAPARVDVAPPAADALELDLVPVGRASSPVEPTRGAVELAPPPGEPPDAIDLAGATVAADLAPAPAEHTPDAGLPTLKPTPDAADLAPARLEPAPGAVDLAPPALDGAAGAADLAPETGGVGPDAVDLAPSPVEPTAGTADLALPPVEPTPGAAGLAPPTGGVRPDAVDLAPPQVEPTAGAGDLTPPPVVPAPDAADLAPARLEPTPAAGLTPPPGEPTPDADLAPPPGEPTPGADLAPARLEPTPDTDLAPPPGEPTPDADLAPPPGEPTPAADLAPPRGELTPDTVDLAPAPVESPSGAFDVATLEPSPASTAAAPAAVVTLPPPAAPEATLLGPDGHELTEPADPVTPSAVAALPVPDQPELLADLAGSLWRGAVVASGEAFAGVGDIVGVTAGAGDDATHLPSPLDWLAVPWPAPRARAVARRLGLTLVDDESGFPAVSWHGLTLSSAALLQGALEKMLGAVAPTDPPRRARVIVPATTTDAARRLLLRQLAGLRVSRCAITLAPTAAAALAPRRDTATLVVEVLALEARLTLLDPKGVVLGTTATFEGGYVRADTLTTTLLASLTPPARRDDPAVRRRLATLARHGRRAAPDATWQLCDAGHVGMLPPGARTSALAELGESIALGCDALSRAHGLAVHDLLVVLAPEEPLWSGALSSIESVLGVAPEVLAPDPWLRLRGLPGVPRPL